MTWHIENRAPTEEEIPEILDLLNRVWHKIYYNKGIFVYTRDVLDWNIKSPYQKSDYFWMVVDDESKKIIGFAVALHRNMKLNGKGPYPFCCGTLITVDLDYQQQGIGKAITAGVPQILKKHDLVGTIFTNEEGSKGIKTMAKDRQARKIPILTIEKAYLRPLNVQGRGALLDMKWYEKFVARLIQGVKHHSDSGIRPVKIEDCKGIVKLLKQYGTSIAFARHWDEQEFQCVLENPLFQGQVVEENGEIKAFAGVAVLPFFVKGEVVKLAILEHCHYENVPPPIQKMLIRSMLYDLKAGDVAAAADFGIGYNSFRPLVANRFVKYHRPMTLYVNPVIDPNDVRIKELQQLNGKIYLDIK